jgi:hypothetical protein
MACRTFLQVPTPYSRTFCPKQPLVLILEARDLPLLSEDIKEFKGLHKLFSIYNEKAGGVAQGIECLPVCLASMRP